MNKQVLLITDMAGVGKVALSVMIPVLSKFGVSVHNLPTAVVSNTLDYGKFDILDTTAFMKNAVNAWKELNFKFDYIATGFIVNNEQAKLVKEFCTDAKKNGAVILTDPIMGDDGHLYPGMGEDAVNNMKELISSADYIVPNFTESCFLTGRKFIENPHEAEIKEIIDDLRKMGAESVVITSCAADNNHKVCCYDKKEDRYFSIPFENIPVRFPGTGDIFSSCLIGSLMKGKNLEESVKKAMDTVKSMIEKNLSNEDKFRGIEIESCLEEI